MNALTKDYGVFGDYKYAHETLLFETNSVSSAIDWAQGYTSQGDTGGYNAVEVVSMVNEQTGEVVWLFEAEIEEDEGVLYDEP